MSHEPCGFTGCTQIGHHGHGTDRAYTRDEIDTSSTREALKRLNGLQPEDGQGRTYARGGLVEPPTSEIPEQHQSPDYVIPRSQAEILYVDTPTSHEVLHTCTCSRIYGSMEAANACFLSHEQQPTCGAPSGTGSETCCEPLGHEGPHGYVQQAPRPAQGNLARPSTLPEQSDTQCLAGQSLGERGDGPERCVRVKDHIGGHIFRPMEILDREDTLETLARDLYEITQPSTAQDYGWESLQKRQREDYVEGAREMQRRGWTKH